MKGVALLAALPAPGILMVSKETDVGVTLLALRLPAPKGILYVTYRDELGVALLAALPAPGILMVSKETDVGVAFFRDV